MTKKVLKEILENFNKNVDSVVDNVKWASNLINKIIYLISDLELEEDEKASIYDLIRFIYIGNYEGAKDILTDWIYEY